jgi:hypothetical protein
MDDGFFTLQTAHDLFAKLQREFDRLSARPTDIDVAWNFFVTADHLVDWV